MKNNKLELTDIAPTIIEARIVLNHLYSAYYENLLPTIEELYRGCANNKDKITFQNLFKVIEDWEFIGVTLSSLMIKMNVLDHEIGEHA